VEENKLPFSFIFPNYLSSFVIKNVCNKFRRLYYYPFVVFYTLGQFWHRLVANKKSLGTELALVQEGFCSCLLGVPLGSFIPAKFISDY
jgi:hypothetical protein